VDRLRTSSSKEKVVLVNLLVFFLLLGMFFPLPAQAKSSSVQVRIDGQKVDFDVQPFIDKQNRTIVPLRFIGEKLGFSVGWTSETREVTVVGENTIIRLWAGKKEALLNSRQVSLDTYAIVYNGRAMVPLRFIMENLGVSVDYDPSTRVVNIIKNGSAGSNISEGGETAVVSPKPDDSTSSPIPEETKEITSLKGKTIVIDPGHAKVQPAGWPDPGAVGPTGLQEKDVVLAIGNKVVEKLKAKGASVLITRTGNTTLTLAGRAAIANNNQADLFVSIHMNSNLNQSYNGTAVYYYSGNQAPQNKKLAQSIQTQLVKSLGLKDIGIIAEQFAVLRSTLVPAVLVETAFISNPEEEKLAYTDEFREKAAQGIVAGIEDYLSK